MPEYSRGIFFLFALLAFLLCIPFSNGYYPPDAKSCVQIINIALKPVKTMFAHKSKLLKLHYFLPALKSLVRVHYCKYLKCYCIFIIHWGIPVWPRNPVDKLQKLPPQQPKPFFVPNSGPKSAIFRACVQMFDKNTMLKLHAMLLCNHSRNVHTCMTSNHRKSTPKFACIMCMRTELPKRMRAGQSHNEFSTDFKTKNTLR